MAWLKSMFLWAKSITSKVTGFATPNTLVPAHIILIQLIHYHLYMGLDATKSVFRDSDKASLTPVSSATEIS